MKKSIFITLTVLLLIVPTAAQMLLSVIKKSDAPATFLNENNFHLETTQNCPNVSVHLQSNDPLKNIYVYSAVVENANPKIKLKYKWTYLLHNKKSKIKSGQGTASITLDNVNFDLGISVWVEVEGLPKGCNRKAGLSEIN